MFHCQGPNPAAEQDTESSLPEAKDLPLTRERGALRESEEERYPAGPATTTLSVVAVPEAQTTKLCY